MKAGPAKPVRYGYVTESTEHCGAKVITESLAARLYAQGLPFIKFDLENETAVVFRGK